VFTQRSPYQLHEALLSVSSGDNRVCAPQTLSTRMTLSPPDGFVSRTAVALLLSLLHLPFDSSAPTTNQTNRDIKTTHGINFLIFLG
jgi:hypothetical protein